MRPLDYFFHWKQVRQELFDTLDKFSAEDLAYEPFPGSWCAGEIALHIGSAEDGWLRYILLHEIPGWPPDPEFSKLSSLAEIKNYLSDVHCKTEAYLDILEEDDLNRIADNPWGEKITILWILCHVLEHEIHHRGELSLILGMRGKEGLDA